MVRQIARVASRTAGSWWYQLTCGHEVIALDYLLALGHKSLAFCPLCWIVEQHRPSIDADAQERPQ